MGVNYSINDVFFVVSARNRENLCSKIYELQKMKVNFVIVCGEKVDFPNVVYQENNGKWSAINLAAKFIPKEAKVIVLNDVDTKIHNFRLALAHLSKRIALVYCRVEVSIGPQVKFYKILDPLRKKLNLCASGELMLIAREAFDRVLPIPACLAEDSYILFKILELGYRTSFCTNAFVTTERTQNAKEETAYKNRTTLGIYQALTHATPPPLTRFFYMILPFLAPILCLVGKDGQSWAKGINRGVKDYLTKNPITKF